MPHFSAILSFYKQHRAECLCLLLFVVLALIGLVSHEITYDEAQSWQIARTAPWKDILLLVPMYEGHPPFWHLLLAGPAKLGASWHWVYGVIGFVCMVTSGCLLFFRAPFPRWVRCLLPFNFFLFYQYGIIVRPYCIIVLLMLLLALYFPQKDQRPGLFVGLLMGLCMCHLFGIAIAGGITLAWLWQMRNARAWKIYIPALCKDKRFHYMLGMLALVIFIVGIIVMPRGGESFASTKPSSIWQQIIYVFLAMPADAVLTNLNAEITTYTKLLPWTNLLLTACVGLVLWAMTLLFFPRKKILFLVLPYICIGCVMLNYSSCHHIGLISLLFIWYLWITLAEDAPITKWPSIVNSLARGLLGLTLLVPIAWNIVSLYNDYRTVTFDGKPMVAFLQKYNLTDEVIFCAWEVLMLHAKNDQATDKTHVEYVTSPNMQPFALLFNVFTDHNMIANFNNGDKNTGYLKNRTVREPQQRAKIFEQWATKGLPMVTLNVPALELVFGGEQELTHLYRVSFLNNYYRLWKFDKERFPINIYLHENLWAKYGAQILADQGITPTTASKPAAQPSAVHTPAQNYTITIYR